MATFVVPSRMTTFVPKPSVRSSLVGLVRHVVEILRASRHPRFFACRQRRVDAHNRKVEQHNKREIDRYNRHVGQVNAHNAATIAGYYRPAT